MKNRRVFQRADCRIPVVVHSGGRFLYGDIVDLSLGGARLALRGDLDAERIELSPKKGLPSGMAVIPLPYDTCWKQDEPENVLLGLQFAGGTDSFFRGWLSDHLNPLMSDFSSLLDHRKLVRVPCQLEARVAWDDESAVCAVLDVSIGGMSFVLDREVFPGLTIEVKLNDELGLGLMEVILLRVQLLTGHYLCGGKFLELSDAQASKLEGLVGDLARKPLSVTLDESP